MKLLRPLFSCAVLLLICGTAAMGQSVHTDWDRTFNLSKLRTYSFYQQERGPRDPLAVSPINDRRIHDALNAQLQTNGFSESVKPDFQIGYFVSTKTGLDRGMPSRKRSGSSE